MTDKALQRPRVLRQGPNSAAPAPRGCCAGLFSPQHAELGVRTARPQPLAGRKRHSPNAAGLCVADDQDNIILADHE